MLKKAMYFTLGTASPLVVALIATSLTRHFFPFSSIPFWFWSPDAKGPEILRVLGWQFSPAILAIIIPFFFGKSPYWATELVNWSGIFCMLYMGFILLTMKMFGIYGIGFGIFIVVMTSPLVAMRLREGKWRRAVVGAYGDG